MTARLIMNKSSKKEGGTPSSNLRKRPKKASQDQPQINNQLEDDDLDPLTNFISSGFENIFAKKQLEPPDTLLDDFWENFILFTKDHNTLSENDL